MYAFSSVQPTGITLNSFSAIIGTSHLPGPGTPRLLPANPLSSQLEHAHRAVVMRNVQAQILPGQLRTRRPVKRLKVTSSPHPTPERRKNPLNGPTAGAGFIDNSPSEW